jgi:hypothetical protein
MKLKPEVQNEARRVALFLPQLNLGRRASHFLFLTLRYFLFGNSNSTFVLRFIWPLSSSSGRMSTITARVGTVASQRNVMAGELVVVRSTGQLGAAMQLPLASLTRIGRYVGMNCLWK